LPKTSSPNVKPLGNLRRSANASVRVFCLFWLQKVLTWMKRRVKQSPSFATRPVPMILGGRVDIGGAWNLKTAVESPGDTVGEFRSGWTTAGGGRQKRLHG